MKLLPVPFKELRRSLPPLRDWFLVSLGALIVIIIVGIVILIHNTQPAVPYQSAGITAQWIPKTVKYWQAPINQMAKKYNLDPNLLAIIMTMESGGDAKAKSDAGAEGLMQVTPPTAREIAAKHLKQPRTKYNLLDPQTNIEFGAAYLAFLRDQFGNAQQGPSWDATVELIAAGYNGGPGAANSVLEGNGLSDTQTVVYSRDAFNMWCERHAADSKTFDRWKERGGTTLLDAAKNSQ